MKHVAESENDVRQQMTFGLGESKTFHRFLDKFKILDEIKWTEETIDESARCISEALQKEGIDYCWLDFSINKYMNIGWSTSEAIEFIYNSFQRHRPHKIGLVLSLKYESMRASQRQYAQLITHEIAEKCLIGIDLVGDEAYFDHEFYSPIFKEWNQANKITRAHVGESQDKENIRKAIADLEVTNIAHGFKIIDDPDTIALAIDHEITFDLALTSNDITGVWPIVYKHPGIKMLEFGLKCTLGSDDPIICGTTLGDEINIALQNGFTTEHMDTMLRTAYQNSLRFIAIS